MTEKTEEWRAFSVHLLTASGAFWAFLALLAAGEGRWVAMFLWLGFALFVDGIDGPLARRLEVGRRLPHWSGDTLDAVIDYSTYVLIPAYALYEAGIIEGPLAFVAAALIVVTSAVYYADTRMKTKDNFFRGFPVTWNMVVFALFATQPGSLAALVVVVFCAVTTFAPLKFLHPVRVARLRPVNLAVFALWSGLGLYSLLSGFAPSSFVTSGIVATSLYLLLIGVVLQGLDHLAGRQEGERS